MPDVLFNPSGKSIQVSPGTELLEAARSADVFMESPCGEKGTCGKCIVKIAQGDVDSDSLGILPAAAIENGFVLACKTRILNTAVIVEVPEQITDADGQFVDDMDDSFLENRELLPDGNASEPLAGKRRIKVSKPAMDDGLSDMDRLSRAIIKSAGIDADLPESGEDDGGQSKSCDAITSSLPVIAKVADALRHENGLVTTTLIPGREKCHMTNIEPGDTVAHHYGIAVDVGTTTVAVQLVSLPERKVLAIKTAYNDQVQCGLDVIGRINYANKPKGLSELRRRVLKTINDLVADVCETGKIIPEHISNAVIAGNTTMIHLLLGLNPEYIRLDPYTPTILEVPLLPAGEIGLCIHPETRVYMSPAVGSYVGGDITSGLLCTDIAAGTSDVILYLDIGTNGELVIGNDDFLMTCACSAGPAFEGGGIGCGMRAAAGAIESVDIDPETAIASYRTVGNIRPAGICGSGMISLLANLYHTGWIDAAGKLNRKKTSPAIITNGRRASYTLVPADGKKTKTPLTISEQDIENIIRAKAAVYSACSLMMEQVGLEFKDIGRVYIAGGFGRYLDLDNAITIGLIPDLPRDRFHFIGNASLRGAYMALVSGKCRDLELELARRMTYIELNTNPGYMDQYVGALFLPHTDAGRFPSARMDV